MIYNLSVANQQKITADDVLFITSQVEVYDTRHLIASDPFSLSACISLCIRIILIRSYCLDCFVWSSLALLFRYHCHLKFKMIFLSAIRSHCNRGSTYVYANIIHPYCLDCCVSSCLILLYLELRAFWIMNDFVPALFSLSCYVSYYVVVTPLRKAASYEQRKTNLGN